VEIEGSVEPRIDHMLIAAGVAVVVGPVIHLEACGVDKMIILRTCHIEVIQ